MHDLKFWQEFIVRIAKIMASSGFYFGRWVIKLYAIMVLQFKNGLLLSN